MWRLDGSVVCSPAHGWTDKGICMQFYLGIVRNCYANEFINCKCNAPHKNAIYWNRKLIEIRRLRFSPLCGCSTIIIWLARQRRPHGQPNSNRKNTILRFAAGGGADGNGANLQNSWGCRLHTLFAFNVRCVSESVWWARACVCVYVFWSELWDGKYAIFRRTRMRRRRRDILMAV